MHEPTDACATVHCHMHYRDEPGAGYIRCFECGHRYRTRFHLWFGYLGRSLESHLDGGRPWWRFEWWPPRPRKIYFCQACSHDF